MSSIFPNEQDEAVLMLLLGETPEVFGEKVSSFFSIPFFVTVLHCSRLSLMMLCSQNRPDFLFVCSLLPGKLHSTGATGSTGSSDCLIAVITGTRIISWCVCEQPHNTVNSVYAPASHSLVFLLVFTYFYFKVIAFLSISTYEYS